jgi:hypothetical protein
MHHFPKQNTMKKIVFNVLAILAICLIHFFANAQPPVKQEQINQSARVPRDLKVPIQGGISNMPDCFCCGDAYNMAPPVISGPDVVKCGTTANFTWPYNCTGVLVGRNFSPLPPGGSGGGNNNSAFISIPPGYIGTITLSVSFNCGSKQVVGTKVFKVECCDCKLPPSFDIKGPRGICQSANCNDELVYTVPSMDNDKCYIYNWVVSPALPSAPTGQGTNAIRIKCKDLKQGSYTVTAEIKCGDKVVKSTIPLTVCPKPNPNFAPNPSPTNPTSGTLVAGFPSTIHYWYIVADNDNNGTVSPGDTHVGPLTGTSASFTNLVVGKNYIFYHFVIQDCNGFACWSSKLIRYAVEPSSMRVNSNDPNANNQPTLRKLDERTINKLQEIPDVLLKKLPADKLELLRKSEYNGHVTLLR